VRKKGDGDATRCGACYHNDYYHANNDRERARRNARRGYLKRQTPPWADLEAIRAIYAGCPPGHEVDHMIPLQGKMVSGLHVEGNLRYLTSLANKQKAATFNPGDQPCSSPSLHL
jgi:hypothetical protein